MRAALVAAAVLALAAPAAQGGSPRVLGVVTTGFGIEISPASVGAQEYTVQVHNLTQYTVKVRMQHGFTVVVPPNGWVFPVVHFHAGTYQVVALAPRHQRWITSVSVNP